MKSDKKNGIKRMTLGNQIVFEIFGFENDPKGYKCAYLSLKREIKRNFIKILTSGRPSPVIRGPIRSMEVH